MKAYKKHLILETTILAVVSIVLIAVQVLAFTRVIVPPVGEHWPDFWNGMIAGASFGLMALFIVGVIINIRALRNDDQLKKLYAKENDERAIEIARRAQSFGMRTSVILMLAVGLILGYFNISVSLTCLAWAFLQSVIAGLAKLYWHKNL